MLFKPHKHWVKEVQQYLSANAAHNNIKTCLDTLMDMHMSPMSLLK